MTKTIEIIEVGPRDGLQNQDAILSTEDKLALIERVIAAGARRIEVCSFVNPKRVPQMADAEAVLAGLKPRDDVTTIGLVLNEQGVDRALQTNVKEIGMVAIASDSFGIRNQKQTAAQSVEVAKTVIRKAKAAGRAAQVTVAVSFGCPFEGEVPLSRVIDMAKSLAEAGPREIAFADTVGVGVPSQVKAIIEAMGREVPGMPLRFHFHNTRNTGLANAFMAVELGVTRIDASVGGIGGCPFAPAATGNIGTEDVVYMLERAGYKTNYDLSKLNAIAPWLAPRLKLDKLPAMVSRVDSFPPLAAE